MGDPRRERDAKRIGEQTFAILTAAYHELPELDSLIEELSGDEARDVVKALSGLTRGLVKDAERFAGAPAGAALPRMVEMLRERAPWLFD